METPQFSISDYVPPGPVANAYIHDFAHPACLIMGPVGSGKTNASFFKALRYAASLPPMRDGVIRAKGAVVRTDYRTLYKTTLASWANWFPKDYPGSHWEGGADRPAVHIVRFRTPRGRKMEITMQFQALGDKRIEDVMRGWEGTFALGDEFDLLEEEALNFMLQRTTRYPPRNDIGIDLEPCVFGALNPPGSPSHWIVERFIKNPKPGHKIYLQPSGLSPQAENTKNLTKTYYQTLAASLPEWDVHRFVHGQVGWDRSGFPVYPEFNISHHIAVQEIKPIPGASIAIGLDISGLHPAVVIVQRAPNLQIRVLEEIYGGRTGLTHFLELLKAALVDRYAENPISLGCYDPSNDYGADKEGGEQTAIDIIRKALQRPGYDAVPLLPAYTNEIKPRIETVRNLLMYPAAPGVYGLQVSPTRCPMLIDGFSSMYRFRKNPDGTVANAEHPRPEKNEHSNPHDALQYICMALVGRVGAIDQAARGSAGAGGPRRPPGSTRLQGGFQL
ncbi:MAG TPA: hypothetical protein VGU72_04360 [Beijerinckiaceae bacterium]|nr:hypothetical protein [Beijerinckiaceae bacterium]